MRLKKALIRAIAESGFDFEDVAIFSGILSNHLVKMCHGNETADDDLKKRIATVVGKPVLQVFPPEEEEIDE